MSLKWQILLNFVIFTTTIRRQNTNKTGRNKQTVSLATQLFGDVIYGSEIRGKVTCKETFRA